MEMGQNLDNPELFKEGDPAGMLEHLHRMPGLCREAWQQALTFALPPDYAGVDKVVILGMGGSAIGGDLVSSLIAPECRRPVIVSRSYELPAFTDSKTLVIASSYSGNTEETLTAFQEATKTGARKLVMTTGGRLAAMAGERGLPVFHIGYQAPPRAALPYSLMPLIAFFQRLGFISDKQAAVDETISALDGLSLIIRETVPQAGNPAKALAARLHNRLPVVYGAGITAEVARRWKTQLNENAKAWAGYEVFPELDHNAVVGYQFPEELSRQMFVVMLRSARLNRRLQLRYEITGELLTQAGVGHDIVDARGESPLAQMMSLVLFGDYVSYYLALLYHTDPTPIAAIELIKQELQKKNIPTQQD